VRHLIAAAVISLAALAASAASASAVTVGAPLNAAANTAEGCEKIVLPPLRPLYAAQGLLPTSCTFFGLDPAGAWTSQTPPGRWVIDQARVRTGPRVGPMVFTVLRALRSKAGTQGIACCTAVAESQVFTPQPNTVNTVPVNMPAVNTVELVDNEQIEVVDYLGITLLTPDSSVPVHIATGPGDPAASAIGTYWAPRVTNGQTRADGGTFSSEILLVNGEYQPAGSGPVPPGPIAVVNPFAVQRSVELLRRGTLAQLAAVVPGAGVLRAASPARARVAGLRGRAAERATASATASAKQKARRGDPRKRALVRPTTVRVEQAGEVKVDVRLNTWGRKLLAKRGRLRLPIKLTYTPTGGRAETKTRRVTFKRPPAKKPGAKRRAKR
jgi:hypothetical protein